MTDQTRVLVIDDDFEMRQLMRRILEMSGHTVEEALDGEEGLWTYRRAQPDVVITDIFMRDMDGLATIKEMLREFPNARIIAVSGGRGEGKVDFLAKARALGARRTLEKPFAQQDLLDAVTAVLQE